LFCERDQGAVRARPCRAAGVGEKHEGQEPGDFTVLLEWAHSPLLAGDLTEELTGLKQQPGKDIVIPGSPTLVRSLLRAGLLDELSLNICPIVVGPGMRLFEEFTDHAGLTVMESRALSTGVLSVTYRPADV
jgi:dihydrofolate reductase